MYYTYILQSKRDGRLYAGFSGNLKKRVASHLGKQVESSRRMGEVHLVFYEAFRDKRDAIRREKYFKTTKGKRALKLMLRHSMQKK